MVSRENGVIAAFAAPILLALYGLSELTTLPTWAAAAVTLGVGAVAPLLVNDYLDGRER